MNPHWTEPHIRETEEGWCAYCEAGMLYGVYETKDDARDALVVYSVNELSGKILTKEQKEIQRCSG